MCRALLVRHALCDPVGHCIAGRMDGIPLNAHGRLQAERLALQLRDESIAAVYTSPLQRAIETARPVARVYELDAVIADAFAEVEFGEWTGRTLAALQHEAAWHDFNTVRSVTPAPGGELMIETQTRALRELLRLRELHRDETIVVVSHGDVIRALICHLLGMPLDHIQRLRVDPASVSEVSLVGRVPELLTLNVT